MSAIVIAFPSSRAPDEDTFNAEIRRLLRSRAGRIAFLRAVAGRAL